MPQIIQVDHFSYLKPMVTTGGSLMFTNAGWYYLTLFTFFVVGSPILTACLPHLRVMAIYCDLLFNDIQPIVVGLIFPFKTVLGHNCHWGLWTEPGDLLSAQRSAARDSATEQWLRPRLMFGMILTYKSYSSWEKSQNHELGISVQLLHHEFRRSA